jgi:hypothetical protein
VSCFEIAAGAKSQTISYPGEEALLFMWRGGGCVALEGNSYALAPYDMLYVPKGKPFSIANPGAETIRMIVTRAPAENVHPVFHCDFAKCSRDESRILIGVIVRRPAPCERLKERVARQQLAGLFAHIEHQEDILPWRRSTSS